VEATTPAVEGLVGYWRLDEGTGLTTADASGNGDDGTLSGEVTWVAGRVGANALNFHGAGVADAHVGIPDAAGLRFTADQSFTVGAWVNATDLPGKWTGLVTKSTDAGAGYGLFIDPTNHWVFATNSDDHALIGSTVTTGWHYVTAVQDGTAGTRQIYVDGVLRGTGTAADASGTGELWLGGSKATNTQYFNGAIDDIRIYSRALSQAEIQDIAATFNPGAVG
jgi:hypothetical protein